MNTRERFVGTLCGEPVDRVPFMKVFGGTNAVHVGDVAEGHLLAAVKGRPGERYILGGQNVSLREMAALCLDHLGLRRRILTVPAAAS